MTSPVPLEDLERPTGVLLSQVVGRTLVVTLNRPAVKNALDPELMSALRGLWALAARATTLRCIVITGAGSGFCSGADAAMLAEDRPEVGETAAEELSFVPGPQVSVPVIAAVNGVCAGGGLHFVADADLCIATEGARFLDPHVSIGQVSALEPLLLRLRMRPDALARMVLLGRAEVLSGTRALEAGLVSELTTPASLLPRALELAAAIEAGSPEAVRLTRRVLRSFEERLLETHLDLGWELIRRHRSHPDAVEGPRAFMERRSPEWKDPS